MLVFAVFFYSSVVDISAVVLTPAGPADRRLSPHYYLHTDSTSGRQLVCDKCPAGTYVSSHCSPTAVRECSPCPEGTFTPNENGVEQCLRCGAQCPAGFMEKQPCASTQDRVCACPPSSFLSRDSGLVCKPHSLCPPGTRVKKQGSETQDVLCKPCARGTFSDVDSSAVKCRTHTDCNAPGLLLLTPGTKDSDNICGTLSSSSSSSSSSVSTSTPVPAQEVGQRPTTSSLASSSLTGPATKGSYSKSAALQLSWGNSGDTGRHAEGLPLSRPNFPNPQIWDLRLTPLLSAQEQQQPKTELMPGPSKEGVIEAVEFEEDVKVKMKISDVGRQGSRGDEDGLSTFQRPTRRGSPKPSTHHHFDINEHLPQMIVLLLLLMLGVIVVCSMKQSSRVLKKGPLQDPSSILEKSVQKKPISPLTQAKERWIFFSNGQGVDILKLVATQVGSQWIHIYQVLAKASEREVAAFSSGYSTDSERAYAALQHWTIRDSNADLAKLIKSLHQHGRTDVVEKIRHVLEDNPQFDINLLMSSVNECQSLRPSHQPLEYPSSICSGTSGSSSSCGSVGRVSDLSLEQSSVDRAKGFFPDESEPLLRCDSTSSKDSSLSRNGSFITKEKKDTVLRQVRLDPCDLQPVFDDMLHILNPEELHIIEELPASEDKLDRLFEIAGIKSQEASQKLLDSIYSHLPDLL